MKPEVLSCGACGIEGADVRVLLVDLKAEKELTGQAPPPGAQYAAEARCSLCAARYRRLLNEIADRWDARHGWPRRTTR